MSDQAPIQISQDSNQLNIVITAEWLACAVRLTIESHAHVSLRSSDAPAPAALDVSACRQCTTYPDCATCPVARTAGVGETPGSPTPAAVPTAPDDFWLTRDEARRAWVSRLVEPLNVLTDRTRAAVASSPYPLNMTEDGRPLNVLTGTTPSASSRAIIDALYADWVTDDRLWKVVLDAGGRKSELPTTAAALLKRVDALSGLGEGVDGVAERVGEGEDLELQLADRADDVVSLDFGHLDQTAGRADEDASDAPADGLGAVEVGHDASPSLGESDNPSVGDEPVGEEPPASPTGDNAGCAECTGAAVWRVHHDEDGGSVNACDRHLDLIAHSLDVLLDEDERLTLERLA